MTAENPSQTIPAQLPGVKNNHTICRELRTHWGAPQRHVDFKAQDKPNPAGWNKALADVQGKLGNGFLVALLGERGNGKTQIAVELMREVTGVKRLRSARYLTAMDFFVRIKATYSALAEETEQDVIRDLRKPAFLVLDEMGKRADNDWENRLIFHLINLRYNDRKDTLLISNQGESEFTASLGPSLISRMNETGGIITCDWPSFRE